MSLGARRCWILLAQIPREPAVRLESRHWTRRGALKKAQFLKNITGGFIVYWVEPINDARTNHSHLDLK